MAKTTPKFTQQELDTLSGIFHRVWDYIGSDCLQMTQEMDGRDYMKKDEVIEVCLDADRPAEQAKTPEEKELLKRFDALPYEESLKLARKMFKYARYGY
jgi:hypothetical protein